MKNDYSLEFEQTTESTAVAAIDTKEKPKKKKKVKTVRIKNEPFLGSRDKTYQNKPSKQTIMMSAVQSTQYEEIMKLENELHVKELLIKQLSDEIKTQKTVNYRQERAIKDMVKEQDDIPKMLNCLHSEIKSYKAEKKIYQERLVMLENNSKSRMEETNRLQIAFVRTSKRLDEADKDELKFEMEENLRKAKIRNEQLVEKMRHMEKLNMMTVHEKNNEVKEIKSKLNLAQREVHELRVILLETQKRLQERERLIENERRALKGLQELKTSETVQGSVIIPESMLSKSSPYYSPRVPSISIDKDELSQLVVGGTDEPASIFKPTLFKKKNYESDNSENEHEYKPNFNRQSRRK